MSRKPKEERELGREKFLQVDRAIRRPEDSDSDGYSLSMLGRIVEKHWQKKMTIVMTA